MIPPIEWHRVYLGDLANTHSLSSKFAALKEARQGALVCFVTAGDPSLDELPLILKSIEAGGADVIEVGIPFSDPIADGHVIQASSQRSLERGTTPTDVLLAIGCCELSIPVVVMGYLNTILAIGEDRFIERAKDSGVSGAIVSDLIPEEAVGWRQLCAGRNFDTVFLVAPTSTEERIRRACDSTTGFVYAVSRTGVTGTDSGGTGNAAGLVERVRAVTTMPVCVGFGIKGPEDVTSACSYADGAIVGSLLVDWLHRHWQNGKGHGDLIELIRSMKMATQSS